MVSTCACTSLSAIAVRSVGSACNRQVAEFRKHGRVWGHLWGGRVNYVIIVTEDDDSLLQLVPLHEALVVMDGGFAVDDIPRFAVWVRTCRMVIH